jgi:hypothetical protein
MIDLGNRILLDDGTVICDQHAMIELLYSGKGVDDVFCSDHRDQEEWQIATRTCDTLIPGPTHASGPQYAGINWFDHWLTPEPWASIDLRSWCLERCRSDEERDRAEAEISAFEQRQMLPAMRHLIYCADRWREKGVCWGVGRGSSVSSFVLHLIGINRINPMEFGLEIAEWLK